MCLNELTPGGTEVEQRSSHIENSNTQVSEFWCHSRPCTASGTRTLCVLLKFLMLEVPVWEPGPLGTEVSLLCGTGPRGHQQQIRL